MRGVELRDVTTAAGRALTQILLVGVAHLTYACQHAAAEPPKPLSKARTDGPFLASAAAARHRCCRGAHRGLSLAPTLTTDDGVWYAVPAHITGDIAGPTFASTRRKDHAAGLAALATEAARRSWCHGVGRRVCTPSLVWRSALMPVHGPTALQAKLKLEGRSVLTCGSLGR